jgi:predicted PurR-regulated permease PerM
LPQEVSQSFLNKVNPSTLFKRALVWLVVLAVVLCLFWMLRGVLLPFVAGTVLAYVLEPVVRRLHRLGQGRLPHWVAVLLVEMLFLLLVLSVLLLLVPILTQELPLMEKQVPTLVQQFVDGIQRLAAELGLTLDLDAVKLKARLMSGWSSSGEGAWASWLPYLQQGGGWALTLLTNLVLLPLVLFYMLSDWDHLTSGLMSWVPPRLHTHFHSFMAECNHVLGQYLRGQLLEMVVLAVFYSAGLYAFGLDLALPIGIFTGLAVCVPYLGYGVGLVLAALAGWLQFDMVHTLTMLVTVYGTGTLLEGFVLTPRLVGKRIGLHPLYVVFALMAFGSLFGLMGVFMALPVSAVMLVALRRLHRYYVHSHFYEDPI